MVAVVEVDVVGCVILVMIHTVDNDANVVVVVVEVIYQSIISCKFISQRLIIFNYIARSKSIIIYCLFKHIRYNNHI